jgi:hypothetical protein
MSVTFPSTTIVTTVTTTATGDLTITNVVLQLHGDGIAASTNSNFVDASTNTFVITRVGTPTQGSVNPFGAYWSNYFGGLGNYMTTNSNPISLTKTTFTIEAWIYMTAASVGTFGAVVGDMVVTGGTTDNWSFGPNASGQLTFYWYPGGSNATGNTVMNTNTWYHIAISVNANAISMYVNGLQQTLTGTTTLTNRTANNNSLAIAQYNNGSGLFTGYISNLRIVVDAALYPSTFTPPTQPLTTATANTQLLVAATNRFQDISTLSSTATVTGSVSVQRFSPFSTSTVYATSTATFQGSTYFDGTSGYLTVPANAAFAFGTGDFTVEAWVYQITRAGSGNYGPQIAGCQIYGVSADWIFNISPTGNLYFQISSFPTGAILSTSTVPLGAWTHCAVVRVSGVVTIYINGVNAGGSASYTTSITNSSTAFSFGGPSNGNGNALLTGYISNLRIIKGTALYTATFTPGTVPLAPVTNTVLLTGQYSNSVVADASTLSNSISVTGVAVPSLRTPFARVDTSTAATLYGGSIYLNGSSYLTVPYSSDINLSTGAPNWTVEFWIYPTSVAAGGFLMVKDYIFGTNFPRYGGYLNTNGTISWYASDGTANQAGTTSIAVSANTWNHLAFVRNGATATIYVNGVLGSSFAISTAMTDNGGPLYIGAYSTPGGYFPGYMSNIRIVKGQALYTANFTPGVVPLTTSSQSATGTVLLLQGTNAGIIDTTMQNNLITTPGAQINTTATTVKYGSGSMGFNGSGYASMTSSTNLTLGSGDFTIEAWVYTTIANQTYGSGIVGTYDGVSNGGWSITINRSTGGPYGIVFIHANTIQQSYTTYLSTGTWYHIAVTRASGTLRTFLNGTQVATGTYATADAVLATCYIGIQGGVAGTGHYGYIDDLRMTKGVARYVNTFTPPTAAFPDLVPITTTATTTSTLATGYTFSTSTYLGTETWTWNTATNRWFSTQEPSQQYTLTPSLIEDQATTSTGYIDFPYGTTAQRPATPSVGYMRFNTDLGLMEYWNTAGTWVQIPAQNT